MKHKKIILIGISLWSIFFLVIFRELFLEFLFKKEYESGNFQEAENIMLSQLFLGAADLHNLGNASYKSSVENEISQHLLEKALLYYSGSLAIAQYPDTRYNYDFVKRLLDTSAQSQEKSQNQNQEEKQETSGKNEEKNEDQYQEQSQGSGSGSQEIPSPENSTTSQSGATASGHIQQSLRGEQYRLSQNQSVEPITPEEQAFLQQYIENLEQEQLENQGFFGKQNTPKSDFEKHFESFFGGSEEKDW